MPHSVKLGIFAERLGDLVIEADYIPNGTEADERLTVADTAIALTASFDPDTTHILLDIQTAAVMVTFDGSNPTTSNGHYLEVGTREVWPVTMAEAAKFIRATSTSAAVHVSQFLRS